MKAATFIPDMVPKKTKRLSAQNRKDSIARAALPLFAHKGFDGVTTRELATACGVSEALIFRHFPTKKDLFAAIREQFRPHIEPTSFRSIKELIPSTETLFKVVFSFVSDVILRDSTVGEPLMRLFYRSFVEDGEFARDFLANARLKRIRELFEASLIEARKSGDALPLPTSPYNFFWFIQHVATAACLIQLPPEPPIRYRGTLNRAVGEIMLFVLRGIGLTEAALEKYATPEQISVWIKTTARERSEP